MRVLVCGGRYYRNQVGLFAALDELHASEPITTVIHGAALGADSLADRWAKWRGIAREVYFPDWKRYGKRAGHIRNQRMLDEGRPELVVSFPGGLGTADMARRALAAKLRLKHFFD